MEASGTKEQRPFIQPIVSEPINKLCIVVVCGYYELIGILFGFGTFRVAVFTQARQRVPTHDESVTI
jgi:hypothetical protein